MVGDMQVLTTYGNNAVIEINLDILKKIKEFLWQEKEKPDFSKYRGFLAKSNPYGNPLKYQREIRSEWN